MDVQYCANNKHWPGAVAAKEANAVGGNQTNAKVWSVPTYGKAKDLQGMYPF